MHFFGSVQEKIGIEIVIQIFLRFTRNKRITFKNFIDLLEGLDFGIQCMDEKSVLEEETKLTFNDHKKSSQFHL